MKQSLNTTLGGALLLVTTLCAATSLPACGDDDDGNPSDNGSAGKGSGGSSGKNGAAGSKNDASNQNSAGSKPDASEGGAGGEPAVTPEGGNGEGGTPVEPAGAVYALTTQVFGETEDQSYVLLTHELAADTKLSLSDAVVEIAGRALGTGPEGSGRLYVASDLGPTVTRYDLSDDGKLAGGSSISFLGKGVTSLGEYGGQFQYVSDNKAYWFDGPTAQVVVWDPSAMKVTGSIPLTTLAAANQTLTFSAAPIRQGNKLYAFAAWREGLAITSRAAVVIVDTKTDQATIVEDTRCGYARDGVLADDGYLYIATEAFGSAAYHLNHDNPVPCMLRLDTKTDELDATFKVTLSQLFEGKDAGSLVVGPNNQAFLRVLDPKAIPDGVTNPRVLAGVPAWSWYKLTPGAEPAVSAIKNVELAGGSVLPFKLGKRRFAPLFIDGEETQFLELTQDGPASKDAVTIPGLVFSAVKLK